MVPNKTKYFMLWLFNSLFDLLEPWIDKDEERFNQLFAKVIIWKRLPLLELLSEPKSMPFLSIIRGYFLANIMTNCNLKIQSMMFLAYMSRYKMSSISASTWTTLITFRQCRNTKAVDLTLFPYLEVVLTLIYNGFRGPVRSFHAPFSKKTKSSIYVNFLVSYYRKFANS